VAFTIDFDNEFEHRMPHRTTSGGAGARERGVPWLVSMAMWLNCMQYVPPEGIPAGDLVRRARIPAKAMELQLKRMGSWWGYLRVRPAPHDTRARPPRSEWLVRPTSGGSQAQSVWQPLAGVIEERWRERFAPATIDDLRVRLDAILDRLDLDLPDFLPIAAQAHALRLSAPALAPREPEREPTRDARPLPVLLAKTLMAFALDYERESAPALAMSANVLRVLTEDGGARVADLPRMTGVARMGIDNSLSLLQRQRYVLVGPGPDGSRVKLARLTAKGRQAHDTYRTRVEEIERRWKASFGEEAVRDLRRPLERLAGAGVAPHSPLLEGLTHYPDGWRAQLPAPHTLPYHPFVSHRGGYPDGA
jgi:DNA-binding MarR family transcriptional regulator